MGILMSLSDDEFRREIVAFVTQQHKINNQTLTSFLGLAKLTLANLPVDQQQEHAEYLKGLAQLLELSKKQVEVTERIMRKMAGGS